MNSYSISRVTTAESCTRKWMGESVYKLPIKMDRSSFTFGTVMHAQIENYLLGRPMYDGDWMKVTENDGSVWRLAPYEGDTIKALIATGLDHGVIVRPPEMQVEHAFEFPLPGLGKFTGKIDVLHRDGVQDHKSAGTTTYLVAQNKLANNIQLMAYALVYFEKYPDADECEIRHNNFVKTGYVDKRPATVTRAQVESMWQTRIMPIMQRMHEARTQYPFETDFLKVPGPHEAGICGKYRGCPFRRICGRAETVEQYRSRMEYAPTTPDSKPTEQLPMTRFARAAAASTTTAPTPPPAPPAAVTPPKAKPESQADRLARLQREKVAAVASSAVAMASAGAPQADELTPSPVAAPSGPPIVDVEGVTIVPVVQAPVQGMDNNLLAPWRNPTCGNTNCRARGYTDDGKMCVGCAGYYKRETNVDASDFFKKGYPRGRLQWVVDGKTYELDLEKGAVKGKDKPPVAAAPTQTTPLASAPAEKAAAAAASQPAPKPRSAGDEMADQLQAELDQITEPPPPVQPPPAAEALRGAGPIPIEQVELDVKGLLPIALMRGVTHTRQIAIRGTVDAQLLFRELAIKLAKAGKVESYYSLDTWKRRDALKVEVLAALKTIPPGTLVLAPHRGDADLDAMVDVIETNSCDTFQGTK
jgi:hypothetical protein